MRNMIAAIPLVLGLSVSACGEEEEVVEAQSMKVADIAPAAAPLPAMYETHVICIIRDSKNEIYYVSDGAIVSAQEGMTPETRAISADYETFIKARYNVGETPSQAECELAKGDETAEALLKRVSSAVYDAGGFVTAVEYSFDQDSAG